MCKGKNVISFTLPTDEPEVLEAAGNMLLGLAGKTPTPRRVAPAPPAAEYEAGTVTNPVHTVAEAAAVPAPPPAPAAMPPAAAAPPAPEAPAAAPPVPPAAPPVPGPAVELDADGFPWDARIHAATKTKMANKDTWKLKRGSDPAMVEQVRAETTAAPGTSAAPAAPEAPAATPAPPAAPEASAAPTTFPDIVAIVHNKQAMELLTVEDIQGVCNAYGLPSFPALAAKQELIPEVYQALEAIWTSKATV